MKNILFALLVFSLISCKNNESKSASDNNEKAANVTSAPAQNQGVVESIKLTKLWETEAELTTAEGVLFDEDRGVYYVSCIGGVPPTKEDGDGFIALVDQRGKVLNKSFVTGMDAPKGMAMSENKIFVTDINDFVIIDAETGKIENRIAVEGAQFLNDVAGAPDGGIYFTDMNTNSVHRYMDGKVELFLQDDALSNPNGIYLDDETIYLASFSKGDLNTVDRESKVITKQAAAAVPAGDGVVPWEGGFLVSNWNGEVYYTTSNWKTSKVLDTKGDKINAADIVFLPFLAIRLRLTKFQMRDNALGERGD